MTGRHVPTFPNAHFLWINHKGTAMPMNLYTNKDFTLDKTSGEAQKLFGDLQGAEKAPKLRIKINDKAEVAFTVTDADPDPGRNFSAEAEARYIDGNIFNSATWPDEQNDIIIGHINWKKEGRQQLFLMWARVDPTDSTKVKLGFFFFANAVRFSCGDGSMSLSDVGQVDGGGSATGPH